MVTNRLYDFLKAFVMVISPSAMAIYLGLAVGLDLPYSLEIVFIVSIITAIIGIFLVVTSRTYHESDIYYDGKMLVSEGQEGTLLYSLELNEDPTPLRLKSRVIFRVVHGPFKEEPPIEENLV